jgi:hypothetical protein
MNPPTVSALPDIAARWWWSELEDAETAAGRRQRLGSVQGFKENKHGKKQKKEQIA